MDISQSSGEIVFRTPYSDQYDLVQFFRGIKKGTNSYNCPVSFLAAGLQHKGHIDIWHLDLVLSFATDECVPQSINGDYIGANHGYQCAVMVFLPDHGKTLADVGSLWKDETGLCWTLLRVENEENLLFLSENLGASKVEFEFANRISGKLFYISHGAHTTDIIPVNQQGKVQLRSANRYLRRVVYAYRNGQRALLTNGADGVDYGEIVEEYEIINPATVAQALRDARPERGYSYEPDLAVGEAMLQCRTVYRVLGDGTVLVIFDHERLQDVNWSGNMGIMYQEKNDVGLGGVWRVIPSLKPLQCDGKSYDFSVPCNTTGGDFPGACRLTPDTWEDPAFPPDHQLDFIRCMDGTCLSAFVGGFLPVYDGEPFVRAANIDSAGLLIFTRKTYPNFAGSPQRNKSLQRTKGVGYRRYFAPEREGCCTNIYPFEDRLYVVMDFYGEEEMVQTYLLPEGSTCQVVSCIGAELQFDDYALTAFAVRGTVLLAIEP